MQNSFSHFSTKNCDFAAKAYERLKNNKYIESLLFRCRIFHKKHFSYTNDEQIKSIAWTENSVYYVCVCGCAFELPFLA